jgi:hypothetical protein
MASIGLRVKTGKAMAIAIAGVQRAPVALLREEVALTDRSNMDTVHPYHLEIEGRPEALAGAVRTAKRVGAASLQRLFEAVGKRERIEHVTIVVNTHTPPERISSPHMRAHSKEGWLFREICEQAVESCGIEPLTLSLDEIALNGRDNQRALAAMGEAFGRPWSADWKLAAAAAWGRLR